MTQCREGWHLTEEPDFTPDRPTADHTALLEFRADLVKAYQQAAGLGAGEADDLRDEIRSVDEELRQLLDMTANVSLIHVSGIVRVTNDPGHLGGTAPGHSFVLSLTWFTDLGPGVEVEQRFGPGNPLVAGFWPPLKTGTGVATDAAGQPAIVSGTDECGTRIVLFGTTPLFREHNKGLVAQFANAVYWSTSH